MQNRIINDSLVSKSEWKRYCETLKNINKELSEVCRQQQQDLREVIILADAPRWFWIALSVAVRKSLSAIVEKYRDRPWHEFKENNEEKGQRPVEASEQGNVAGDAQSDSLAQGKN
jgi:hypothetical protein